MMNPIFLNQMNYEDFDLNQDHIPQDQQQVLESSPYYPSSNTASSISNLHLEQGLGMGAAHSMSDQPLTFDQLEGSKNLLFSMVSPSYEGQMTSTNNYGPHNQDIFIFKRRDDQETNNQNSIEGAATENGSSLRWMSSKTRMMRKMINSNNIKTGPTNGSRIISSNNKDLDHGSHIATNDLDANNDNGIRVCSDCNTTKTPLWRSGPQGPKTLCNACGIRQRKARKAAMEAAAAAAASAMVTHSSNEASSSTSTKTTTIKLKINKEKNKNKSRATSNTCVSQHINKKQTPCNKQQGNDQLVDSVHNNNSSSTSNSSKRQMIFEEFAVDLLSKNAAFHRMFPQDEEEGALLLMALSYGLIQS